MRTASKSVRIQASLCFPPCLLIKTNVVASGCIALDPWTAASTERHSLCSPRESIKKWFTLGSSSLFSPCTKKDNDEWCTLDMPGLTGTCPIDSNVTPPINQETTLSPQRLDLPDSAWCLLRAESELYLMHEGVFIVYLASMQ